MDATRAQFTVERIEQFIKLVHHQPVPEPELQKRLIDDLDYLRNRLWQGELSLPLDHKIKRPINYVVREGIYEEPRHNEYWDRSNDIYDLLFSRRWPLKRWQCQPAEPDETDRANMLNEMTQLVLSIQCLDADAICGRLETVLLDHDALYNKHDGYFDSYTRYRFGDYLKKQKDIKVEWDAEHRFFMLFDKARYLVSSALEKPSLHITFVAENGEVKEFNFDCIFGFVDGRWDWVDFSY